MPNNSSGLGGSFKLPDIKGKLKFEATVDASKVINEIRIIADTMDKAMGGNDLSKYWKDQASLIQDAIRYAEEFQDNMYWGFDEDITKSAQELFKTIQAIKAVTDDVDLESIFGDSFYNVNESLKEAEQQLDGIFKNAFNQNTFKDAFLIFDALKSEGFEVSEAFERLGSSHTIDTLKEQNSQLNEELIQTRDLVDSVQRKLDESADANFVESLKSTNDALQSTLDNLRDGFTKEFSTFLSANKLDSNANGAFKSYFDEIIEQGKTATEVITEFRTKEIALFREGFDAGAGNNLVEQLTEVKETLISVIREVGSGNAGLASGGMQQANTTLNNIVTELKELQPTADAASNSTSTLVDSLKELASTDLDKLSSIGNILAQLNLAKNMNGKSITESAVTNLRGLFSAADSLKNPSNLLILSNLNLKGFSDLKVDKASIKSLADSLPALGNIDTDKIRSFLELPFSNLSQISEQKSSISAIKGIVTALSQIKPGALAGLQNFNSNGLPKFLEQLLPFTDGSEKTFATLAKGLNALSQINANKLQKLSEVDFSNFSNLKIDKSSISSLSNIKDLMALVKELKGIDLSAVKKASDSGKSSTTTLVTDSKKYLDSLKQIIEYRNKLQAQLDKGSGLGKDVSGLSTQISELNSLEEKLKTGAMTAQEFGEAFLKIKDAAGQAINDIDAQSAKLVNGTKEYKAALKEVDDALASMQKSADKFSGIQGDDGQSKLAGLQEQINAMKSLKAQVESGKLSNEDYAKSYSDITSKVADLTRELDSVVAAQKREADAQKESTKAARENASELKKQQSAATQLAKLQERVSKAQTWTASASGRTSDDYAKLEVYANELQRIQGILKQNPTGDVLKQALADLDKVNTGLTQTESIIKSAGENTQSLLGRVGKLGAYFATWFSATRIVMQLVNSFKQMVSNVREIDQAFTQLQIVTGATDSEIEQFFSRSTELAKGLGRSITDVAKSMETFSRLGYNLEDASVLTEYASIMANVADVGVDEATTGLTSIIKGFNMEVSDAGHAADVLVEVGQKYAISASEMMEAFERSGSALNATGTSFEKSAGLLAAANAAVQNASTVGTALKTVSARIRGSQTEAEELGEDISDLADGFSKYAKEIQELTGFDIMVEGTTNQFKDIYDIFEGIAGVWDDLSDTAQSRVSEILGGTRQLQIISSIMANWEDAAGAYEAAMNSAGVATRANAEYIDTIDAKVNKFKATFQEFSVKLIDSKLVKNIVDFGTSLLSTASGAVTLIEKLGGLKTILLSIAGISIIKDGEGILTKIVGGLGDGIRGVGSKIESNVNVVKTLVSDIKDATKAASEAGTGIRGFFESISVSAGSTLILAGVAAAITGIVVAIKAYQAAHPTLAQLQEDLAALKENLASMEGDLETNKERLQELYDLRNQGKLSIIEEEELNNLEDENILLESQIALQERLVELKRQEAATKAQQDAKSLFGYNVSDFIGDENYVASQTQQLQNNIDNYKTAYKNWKDISQKLANESANLSDKQIKDLQRQLSSAKTTMDGALNYMADRQAQLLSIRQSLADDPTILSQSYVAQIDDQLFGIDAAIGNFESILARVRSLPENITTQLTNMGKGFTLTEASIRKLASTNPELQTLIDTFDKYGVSLDKMMMEFAKTPKSTDEAVEGLKKYIEASKDAGASLTDITNSEYFKYLSSFIDNTSEKIDLAAGAVKNFTDIIDEEMSKNIDTVKARIAELEDAYSKFTVGEVTVDELIGDFPELANYLDDIGAGLQKLRADAPKELIDQLQRFKETNNLTDNAAQAIDLLCDSLNGISTVTGVNTLTEQFGRLGEAIHNSRQEYTKLDEILSGPDYDVDYEKQISYYEKLVELSEKGAIGSKQYEALAENFGLVEKSEREIQQWLKDNAKYFEDAEKGYLNFIDTVKREGSVGGLLEGIASVGDNGEFWFDSSKIHEFADALGWSDGLLAAFLENLKMYYKDLDIGMEETANDVDSATDDIARSVNDGADSVEEAAVRIEKAVDSVDKSLNSLNPGKHFARNHGAVSVDDFSDIVEASTTANEITYTVNGKVNDEELKAFIDALDKLDTDGWNRTLIVTNIINGESKLVQVRNLLDYIKKNKNQTVNITVKQNGKVTDTTSNTTTRGSHSGGGGIKEYNPADGLSLYSGKVTATGSKKFEGGKTLLGDEYSPDGSPRPELVVANGKAYLAGENGPIMATLPKGAIIYTYDETKKILQGSIKSQIPAFADGNSASYSGANQAILNYINSNNKGTASVTVDVNLQVKDEELTEKFQEKIQEMQNALDTTLKSYSDQLDIIQAKSRNLELNVNTLDQYKQDATDIISLYEKMQEEIRDQQQALRDMGLSDQSSEIMDLEKQWYDYAAAIDDVQSSVYSDLQSMASVASQLVTDMQDVINTLQAAAEEFNANDGIISIDTLQQLLALEPQYLAYLQDSNGQLQVTVDRVNQVIAAKTEQMGIESALAYVEQLAAAQAAGDAAKMAELTSATREATTATWGLVEAKLAALGLDSEELAGAENYINMIHQLTDSAIAGIGQYSGYVESSAGGTAESYSSAAESAEDLTEEMEDTVDATEEENRRLEETRKRLEAAKEELEDMKEGVDEILDLTMDMIKDKIEQEIDAIEDLKDSYADLVDLKKESLNLTKEEEDYEKALSKKVQEIAKLQEKISALSLDNSRAANAERLALEEQLAEMMDDVADTQREHSISAQEEALDAMRVSYEQEKDAEIKELENSISSQQKIYDMAIDYISNNWNTLYSDLREWNYEYGSTLESELTEAWGQALSAAQKYGSYLNALKNLEKDIGKLDEQIEATNNRSSSSTSSTSSSTSSSSTSGVSSGGGYGGGGGSYSIGGTKKTNTSTYDLSDAEAAGSIISQMKTNSNNWALTTDKDARKDLHDDNVSLANELRRYGISASYNEGNGIWTITDDKFNTANAGKKLYSVYHKGGIVGDNPSFKQNEVMALLEKGEAVLDEKKEKALYKIVDLVSYFNDKIKSFASNFSGDLSMLKSKEPLTVTGSLLEDIVNSRPSITFGDVYITGASDETVQKHIEVNRKFVNDVLSQLNIRR